MVYPIALCDTVFRLAQRDLFVAQWTEYIFEEAQRNLIASGKYEAAKIRRRFEQLRKHFDSSKIEGFEILIPAMHCDEKDRHVLAAAVHGGAKQIVTNNIKDFPPASTEPYGIEVITPDDFLLNVADLHPKITLEVIKQQAADLRRPPMSVEDVLKALAKCGTPQFAQTMADIIEEELIST